MRYGSLTSYVFIQKPTVISKDTQKSLQGTVETTRTPAATSEETRLLIYRLIHRQRSKQYES